MSEWSDKLGVVAHLGVITDNHFQQLEGQIQPIGCLRFCSSRPCGGICEWLFSLFTFCSCCWLLLLLLLLIRYLRAESTPGEVETREAFLMSILCEVSYMAARGYNSI